MVAPEAEAGNLVAAFFFFHFSGFKSCRIRLLSQNSVLIKNLSRAERILVDLIQQHIAESDGFISGGILAPVLLVREVAG